MFAQILSYDVCNLARMRRKKKGPRSLREAEAEGLVFVVFVQDRGDRTRVAALVREAASHVEREKGRTAHGIPWWSPTQVLTMPEAA